jgi:hypothetical protein
MSGGGEPVAPTKRLRFRRSRGLSLSPEREKRQWLITNLAFASLGGRDAAISFLNTHNDALGARPIDRAMSNASGYAAVAEVIHALVRAPKERSQ